RRTRGAAVLPRAPRARPSRAVRACVRRGRPARWRPRRSAAAPPAGSHARRARSTGCPPLALFPTAELGQALSLLVGGLGFAHQLGHELIAVFQKLLAHAPAVPRADGVLAEERKRDGGID